MHPVHNFPPCFPNIHSNVFFPSCVNISQQDIFIYGEEILSPRPTPKLEDHPLSVRDCLFITFITFQHSKLKGSLGIPPLGYKERHLGVSRDWTLEKEYVIEMTFCDMNLHNLSRKLENLKEIIKERGTHLLQ
jgi:hypothetical protein